MKLFITLSLLISMNGFACSTYEAQFSSFVKEVKKDLNDPYLCQIKLNLNLAQAGQTWTGHGFCPLSPEMVVDRFITVKNCNLVKGQKISGYILDLGNSLELE
jgi:hypothetical protein